MKILMVNDNDPCATIGGSERYLVDATHALEATGHEVHWFVLGVDGASTTPRGRRRRTVFPVPPASRPRWIARHVCFYPRLYRALGNRIAEIRPDVVHLHNNYRHPITILAAMRRVPVVQTVHDYCAAYPTAHCVHEPSCAERSVWVALRHGCVNWRLLATEGWLLYGRRLIDRRLVDRFIAPSRNLAGRLERAGHAKVRHLHNFRSLPCAEPAPPPASQVLLYVGQLIAHKGVDVLLGAYEKVLRQVPGAALWLVGGGPGEDSLKASVAERGLHGVRFLGTRPAADLAAIYTEARAVVIPSLWLENAPLVAIEATAHGRAIVASRVGGLPELVQHGETGYLCPRGDTNDLAGRLRDLLSDRSLAARLGAAGYRRFAHLRNPDRHVLGLVDIYREVLAR